MEPKRLIERARAGDIEAFTELTRRYQNLAFGYAYSTLRDFHLAEDAAQEAFIAAYFSLKKLKDPAAFPGWLRGIVRHQCARILRKRPAISVTLDHAIAVASESSGPDCQLESKETFDSVVSAINALPQAERDVTMLYYIQEFSQEEIAAFLSLPVTKVNNRLHSARTKLRRRMMAMVKDTFRKKALPKEFASNVGRIIKVHGTIVDARFRVDELPAVMNSLIVLDEMPGGVRTMKMTVEVAQHLGNGLVRCVAMSCSEMLKPGMRVADTQAASNLPYDKENLRRAVESLEAPRKKSGRTAREQKNIEILETGIKAIDLFCPFKKGGKVGIFGDMQVGKLVLIEELARRVAASGEALSLFAYIQTEEIPIAQSAAKETSHSGAQSAVKTFYFHSGPVAEPESSAVKEFSIDAIVFISKSIARRGIYPAIDLFYSPSRLLDPAIVGREHYEAAGRARELLRRFNEVESKGVVPQKLSKSDQLIVSRGRRLQMFMSQPFIVAEPYTKVSGKRVSREETVRACLSIIEGEYDDLPEKAFYFVGGIDEVKEKAKTD